MAQGHTNPFLDNLEIFLSLNWYSVSAQQNSGDLVPSMPFLYFLRVFNAMGVILEISLCTFLLVTVFFPFPCGSAGKESTCSVGDLGSTPGLGRSPGERTVYPLQYSWTSLVAQLIKNLPAMQETWVQPLGWEDPLEKGKATQTSILAWGIPGTL